MPHKKIGRTILPEGKTALCGNQTQKSMGTRHRKVWIVTGRGDVEGNKHSKKNQKLRQSDNIIKVEEEKNYKKEIDS